MRPSRRVLVGWFRRLAPLLYLIPLAYLVQPVFWAPLEHRFYNYFHAKRSVPPWNDVVVVGIDEATRDEVFDPPVYPVSRHIEEHASVVRQLHAAGARGIVLDLELASRSFEGQPRELADALRTSGATYLVATLRENGRLPPGGAISTYLTCNLPDTMLLRASGGAYVADVQMDSDGVVRRFEPDDRLRSLGLTTLPERVSGTDVRGSVPIEFPSVDHAIPSVSYRDVLRGDPGIASKVSGRIAFIGLVEDSYTDYVFVPRPQGTAGGAQTFGLPGVVVLAAITETLIRGGPIRDAGGGVTLLWNVIWCVACVLILPRKWPAMAAAAFVATIAAGLIVTGLIHVHVGFVLPAGLLFGCLFLAGSHAIVASYVRTTKELHVEEVENERVRREMEMARRTQERFLPVEIPRVSGLDVWGINVSSLAVSGDYYDVLDLGEGRPLVVAIADVSGKGLPASLIMSNVQAGLHCHAAQERFDIRQTAENLNRLVHRNTDPGKFVTLFLGEIDKITHRLRYVRPGHDVPILVSIDGRVRTLDEGGLVLGFTPEAEYAVCEEQLEAGDVLCLYTDGVTEARDPDDEEYQIERLTDLVVSNRDRPAEEIGEAILNNVRAFSQSEQQADDVTLLIVKVGTA